MGKETYLYGKAWALADGGARILLICLVLTMKSPADDDNGVLSKQDAENYRCGACCECDHLE